MNARERGGRLSAWLRRLGRRAAARPALGQTLFLFAVDGFANLLDYGFHIYLGRALRPAAFAAVQTINAALLVLLTTFAVLQPVVARALAQVRAEGAGLPAERALFRVYFRRGALLGAAVTVLAWAGRELLGRGLNVPPGAVGVAAAMGLFALLRPVVAGVLQGQQRFVAFGLTRVAYAGGRLLLGLILLGLLGGGLLAAVATLPLAGLLALLLGLALIAPLLAGPAAPDGTATPGAGWSLSLAALVAYAAYMALLNLDLVWVNRTFAPETAAAYATAVLLRRALALLPGAVVLILYPRVVDRVTRGRRPDRLLLQAAATVLLATAVFTALYFVLGPLLLRLTFGARYLSAAPLLGWMGVAMIGYGLLVIWLNLYLATRPAPFVLLLLAAALAQSLLYAGFHAGLVQIVVIFALGGWVPALGGLLLYLLWLRPRL